MKTKPRVSIYDTTLRDGNQAISINLSLSDKLSIADKLDELGFHYIEGGWPNATNTVDTEFYRQVAKKRFRARIAVFGSTRRPHMTCAKDELMQALVQSGAPVATIYGKSWDLHVKQVIKTSLDENLAMIHDSVSFLKRHMDEVFYDAEHFFDGYLHNPEYAMKTLAAARDAGADVLVLCDTNGGMMPDRFQTVYREVAERVGGALGVHAHNDAGCAEANSFLAVNLGAVQVQGTMNGLGERCGNANLCTLVPGIQLKYGIRTVTDAQLGMLTAASIFISEIANVSHNIRQPYVGQAAFSHKAGAHADGVLKVRESFEHVSPESVGNMRRFVVSDQAGRSMILEKILQIKPGIEKSDPLVKRVLLRMKDLESAGYQFEAADASFELMVREELGLVTDPFIVKGFRVIEEQRENGALFSEATIKIEENGVFEHTAAEGDGPVNSLDNALRKALIKFFPSIKEVKLEDFKVRVLDGTEGTAAKVRVLIESSDGKSRWGTIGVSTNIIEASWIALTDSLKYKLAKDRQSVTKR